ncbi:hypothetical protein FJT64_013097 [Amphibalanus amphitrite]|uniref:Uncharacterized protein n=1 Tax=Amphibalanus amphitrite TaxID=1232801 RepID=A0A6A4VAG1_AMPAM|nr:hypothetical protein FJT64_013097 [Amphibalanus amphitrite]
MFCIYRSKGENYSPDAVGYVQLKREDSVCTLHARVTPETQELEIGGSRCRRVALIDSGCTRTLVHESVCHQWRRSAAEVITVNGQRLQCEGAAEVLLAVPGCRAVELLLLLLSRLRERHTPCHHTEDQQSPDNSVTMTSV